MVIYLKVNRNELYTFRNLQHWVNSIELIPEVKYYILCDNDELKQEIIKKVVFKNNFVEFLESYKTSEELNDIVSSITDNAWRNAGYAHLTTFYHAKQNQYPYFWNIDADDTCICLSPKRVCEILCTIQIYAQKNQVSTISLDMWISRTYGKHWSFGINYVNNTVDWFGIIKNHYKDEKLKSKQIRNIDGYFSCLKSCTNLKIETFYIENLKFIHYSNDFFKRPHSSGFFYWKNGELMFPILLYCFGIDSLGKIPIEKNVIKFDINITDEESADFLLNYALLEEKETIENFKRWFR